MAGEIFIARQDTLEDVQGTVSAIDTNVDAVNTTTTAIKSETENIKADTEALKLSTDSIKQIADTILERIGLTTDSGGGANTGTVLGKLNALFSSGGGGIKSVQRGIIVDKECDTVDPVFKQYYIFLNLQKPINPEKSFLLIQNFSPAIPDDPKYSFHCVGRIYSSTQLVLYGNYESRSGTMYVRNVLWEVVEFN